MDTLHIVVDTNILVSAQRSQKGASAKLMSRIGIDDFEIHLSVPLVLEYEAVLLRMREALGLLQQDVHDFIDALCHLGHRHNIHFLWRPSLPDQKDEMILELVIAAQCDYIVTYNLKDFRGAEKFGIQVVDARTFLQKLGAMP